MSHVRFGVPRRRSLPLIVLLLPTVACSERTNRALDAVPLDSGRAVALAIETVDHHSPSAVWEPICYSRLDESTALIHLRLGPSRAMADSGLGLETTDGSGLADVAVTADGRAFRLRLEFDSLFLHGHDLPKQERELVYRVDSSKAVANATAAVGGELTPGVSTIVHCAADVQTGWLVTLVQLSNDDVPGGVRAWFVGVDLDGQGRIVGRFRSQGALSP